MVQNPAAAAVTSAVVIPTMFDPLPVQPVPRVTPVVPTVIRPVETIKTLSPSGVVRVPMSLPPLMPAKSVVSLVASATPIAPATVVTSPTLTPTATTVSASPMTVNLSPTTSCRPRLIVSIPNTRNTAAFQDVSRHCVTLLLLVRV